MVSEFPEMRLARLVIRGFAGFPFLIYNILGRQIKDRPEKFSALVDLENNFALGITSGKGEEKNKFGYEIPQNPEYYEMPIKYPLRESADKKIYGKWISKWYASRNKLNSAFNRLLPVRANRYDFYWHFKFTFNKFNVFL